MEHSYTSNVHLFSANFNLQVTRINYNDSRKLATSPRLIFCLNVHSGNNDRLDVRDRKHQIFQLMNSPVDLSRKSLATLVPLSQHPYQDLPLRGLADAGRLIRANLTHSCPRIPLYD